MARRLVHRGPDDGRLVLLSTSTGDFRCLPADAVAHPEEGHRFDLGFAFRRLKIIDLSERAAQPMFGADNETCIVFNGEIYNYLELRTELRGRGRVFRTDSDTEVLLAIYEMDGVRGFERLNGMFALAIWDSRKRRLVLARDRFGIKPLYYAATDDAFVFGSEIKALFCHPSLRRAIDAQSLAEHFTFQFPLGDRTLFRGVRLVEPGTYMVLADGKLSAHEFWRLRYQPRSALRLQDAAAELRARLEAALTRQLRSDVPVGTFLSGGMDTGAIASLAGRAIRPLHSFTAGFNTQGLSGLEGFFDERPEARALAAHLGTEHHETEIIPTDLLRLIPRVAWHVEDPRVGISHQIYSVARDTRREVTVVMSGTGGDELFAGYPWRYRPVMEGTAADFSNRLYRVWSRLRDEAGRARLLSARAQQESGSAATPRQAFQSMLARHPEGDPLDRALFFEAATFLQGLLLVEDRLTMAHGVEARVPLLDNDVVDLLLELPATMKFDGNETKIVLKQAVAGLVPADVLTRRKQGFTPPEATWMRRHSGNAIQDLLLHDRSLDRGWFEPAGVRDILDEHMSGLADHRFLIWSLMMFEWTNRLFIDGDGGECPDVSYPA